MSFSGQETSEKGFPRGWDIDAEDQASQRQFRIARLLEAMVFRPFSWDRFASLNLRYAFHGGYIDTGAAWLKIDNGTVALVDGQKNYIERTDAGNVVVNQSAFTYVDHIPMATIEARNGAFVATTYVDSRPEIGGAPAGGGGGLITFAQILGQILDSQVPLSVVAQWQFQLAISFTQMIDAIADGQVPESAVTQHEAALSLLFTQLTDQIADGQVPESAVTQHEAALSLLFTQITDQIADAQVPESAVTQHNAALDHGLLQGLADDDHLQYLLLAGRAGGQSAFGSPTTAESLTLQGNSSGVDPGFVFLNSPVIFGPYSANPLAAYGFDYSVAESFPGVFIGGGLNFSGIIDFSSGTFIYESFRGAPTITSLANPVFAAYTVLQALPALQAGPGAGNNPLAPLIINAGPAVVNSFAGTRTVTLVSALNWAALVRTTLSGAVMNVVDFTAITAGPKFSTVLGSTIDFGTIRGLHCVNPGPGLFQPQAGTETMVAYYGLDVEAIPFGGGVEKAAVRSALTIDTNSWLLLNTGGAWSDHGDGFMKWNDNAGIIFGSGTDVFIRWNSVTQAIEYNTFFGMGNSPVHFRPNGDNSWDFFSTNPLGLGYNVDTVTYGDVSAEPGGNNWFVNYTALAGREPASAGAYSDILFATGGDLDLNGLAMTDVQAWEIQALTVIGGGSIDDLSTLFLNAMSTAGGTRMQALRVLGRSRMDGLLTHNEASLTQLTADVAQVTLPADNAGRFVLLQDADANGPWTIQGVLNVQVGDAFYIVNDGANAFILGHQDAAAAAIDRIISPTGVDLILGPDEMAKLWYDPVATRWRILETTGA